MRLGAKTEKGNTLTNEGTCTALSVSQTSDGEIFKRVFVNGQWYGLSNIENPEPKSASPWLITGVDV